jgi:Uma2 family endonuclease
VGIQEQIMVIAALPVEDISVVNVEQRLVLDDIDWNTYRKLSETLSGRHLRVTYDRGRLELMTISRLHGTLCRLLAQLIAVLTEEFNLPCGSCGDMTCDSEPLDRGIEPDECFYIENEPRVRTRDHIDLSVDPPPDLAIEVDVSRDSRRRLSVYAALGVPEVWRFDGERLTIYSRQPDGKYQIVDRSPHFPTVPSSEVEGVIARRSEMDHNGLARLFRARVRELNVS